MYHSVLLVLLESKQSNFTPNDNTWNDNPNEQNNLLEGPYGGFVLNWTGKARIWADFMQLNQYVMREIYLLAPVKSIILEDETELPEIDASSRLFQIPLSPESSMQTHCFSHKRSQKYLRLHRGVCSTSEIGFAEMTRIVDGIEPLITLMNALLEFGQDSLEHNLRLQGDLDLIN